MSAHAAITHSARDTSKKPITRSLRGAALWVPAAIGISAPAPHTAASSAATQLANAAYTMSHKVLYVVDHVSESSPTSLRTSAFGVPTRAGDAPGVDHTRSRRNVQKSVAAETVGKRRWMMT